MKRTARQRPRLGPDSDRFGLDAGAVTICHQTDLALPLGRFVELVIPFAALQIALARVYVVPVLR